MSRNFKSYNRRNDLYVAPPFRKYQTSGGFSGSDGQQNSGRHYDNFSGSSGHGNAGGNMGRRFEGGRGDYHQKGAPRFDPYKGNRGNNRRHNKNRKNRRNQPPEYDLTLLDRQWFKIGVPYGKRWGKDWIFNEINSVIEAPFNPIGYIEDGSAAYFYVDSANTANAIRSKSKCITTREGSKLTLMVSRSGPPLTPLNPEVTEKLKLCMSNRFNTETNVLNLSQFQKDADLRREGIFLPISRPNVFDSIVKIINENIPQLLGLDLSGNRIERLNGLAALITCKNLKSLSLKNNNIGMMNEFNHLKGLALEELVLDENPICDAFKDQATYIRLNST